MKKFDMKIIPQDKPIVVYKLVEIYKDGTLHPLFLDKQNEFKVGVAKKCRFVENRNFAGRSITEDELIGGFHCCLQPVAPHLSEELASGKKRVWIKCYAWGRSRMYDRPESQGGAWILVEYLEMLEQLPYEEVRKLQGEYNEKLLSSQPVLKSRTA